MRQAMRMASDLRRQVVPVASNKDGAVASEIRRRARQTNPKHTVAADVKIWSAMRPTQGLAVKARGTANGATDGVGIYRRHNVWHPCLER
jgi:hypothetical protein